MRRLFVLFIINYIASFCLLCANSYSIDSIKLESINNDIIECMAILNDNANNNTKSYKKAVRTLRKLNKLANEYCQITNDSSVFINSFVGEYYTSMFFRDLNMIDSAYVHAQNAYNLYNPYGKMVCSSDTSSWAIKIFGNDGILGILRDWNVKQNNMQEAIKYCSIITDSCRTLGTNSEMLQSLIKTGEIYEKFDDYENSIICRTNAIDEKLKMGTTDGDLSNIKMIAGLLNTYKKWFTWVNKYYVSESQRKTFDNYADTLFNIFNITGNAFSEEYDGNTKDALLFVNNLVEIAEIAQSYDAILNQEKKLDDIYELICGKESITYANWLIKKHDIYEMYVSSKAQFKKLYKRKSELYLDNAFSIWDNYLAKNPIESILKECKKKKNRLNNKDSQDSLGIFDILDNYYIYLSKLGKNKFDKGLYSDARSISKQRMKISKIFNLKDNTNDFCCMGDTYLDSNEYKKAEKWYQKALKNAESLNDTIEMAKAYVPLWVLYTSPHFYKDKHQLANKAINKAYDLISKTNCRSIEKCAILFSLSKFFQSNYNYKLALDLNHKATLELMALRKPVPVWAYVDDALNQTHLIGKMSDYTLEELLEISLNNDSTFVTQKAAELLGSYYLSFTSDFDKAFYYYSKAYDIAIILNDTISQFNYLADIGILYYIQNDYEKALKYMLDAESVYPQKAIVSELISLMTHIDNKELVENRVSRKFQIVRNQIKDRILLLTSQGRESYINEEMSNFRQFRSMPYYYPESKVCKEVSYNSILLYKGLLLNTQKDIISIIKKTKDKRIKNLYQNLQDKYAHNHALIVRNEDTSIMQNNIEIENLETELISELTKKSLFTFSDVTWEQIKNHLKKNDVAIEFTEINNLDPLNHTSFCYGALILRNDYDVPKFVILDSKEKIDGNIETLLSLFNKGIRMNNEKWSDSSERLYKSIWGKLENFVNEGDNIYFSLDGLLNKAPIEVLSDSDGVMINEKYNLFRLSSTRELCKQRKEDISKVVLYGGLLYDAKNNGQEVDSIEVFQYYRNDSIRSGWNYLPSSSTEVDTISYLLSSQGIKTIKRKGLKGTEESFKKLSGSDISTIHIATHGFYFPQQEAHYIDYFHKNESYDYISPMKRSGLMMTGGQSAWLGTKKIEKERDGILTAEEIATINLSNVNMVVLSACQTGLGDIDPGAEGVLGIQRAFKMAGVQSLLMSLWKVDDNATAYMMQEFYSGLLSGETKHNAFKTAQQRVRNKYSNPFYWAGFVMLD